MRKEIEKMKNKLNNKKIILSITQILILLIGILAFNYLIGEIGKQKGIEISRGIGFVGAQEIESYNCDAPEEKSCSTDYKQVLQCNPTEQLWVELDNCEEKNYVCKNKECWNPDENDDGKLDGNEKKGLENYLGEIGTSVATATLTNILTKWATKTAGTGGTAGSVGGTIPGPVGMGGTGQLSASGEEYAAWLAKNPLPDKASFISFTGQGTMFANIFGSFVAAVGTALAIYFIFKFAGASEQNLRMIANSGIFAVSAATAGILIMALASSGPVGWIFALGVAQMMGIWILFSYQNYVQEIINYQINAWKAQEGGAKCDECNKLEYGCTEYQCKTFGQGCGIVNNGTKQERCVWLNPNDREYPVIIEDAEISQFPENYNYKKSAEISPPDTGVEITSASKNCIPPFSSLILGVKTDEPAQCRISTSREKTFELMTKDMDEGALAIEKHTKIIPNSATANNWALNNLIDKSGLPDENQDGVPDIEFEITKGNEYEYYIKCKDTNGNENPANFVIKFCIQDKDLTAPIIKGFFVANGGFVQFGTSNVTTEVYTNEPAECKWDFNDKKYDEMTYAMTNCDTTINQATVQGNSCTGKFTGLKNGVENKYYIRCQDRSEDKNTNSVSEVYNLKVSSQSILIDSISVNGKGNNSIIKDAREVIPVDLEIKTSFGAEDGKAKCDYEYLGNKISMSFEYSEVNTQTLWLPEGKYELPISCNDIAGDTDTGSISFTIVKDRDAPIVARAYYDVNNLKVITNEPAECVYTLQQNLGCAYNFIDGTAMSEIGELTHYTSWQAGKKYFVKCKDAFGNQPLPGKCSIIVKAFESY